MSEEADSTEARPVDAVGRVLYALARLVALVGGLVFVAMTVMEVLSVSMRGILGAPIPGDFELVQLGTAVAVFGFLPYCQIRRANFIVDFVLARAPERLKRACDAVGGLLFGTIAAVMTWRMVLGGAELRAVEEKTMVLGLSVWIAFPPVIVSLGLLAAVCLYVVWRDLGTART